MWTMTTRPALAVVRHPFVLLPFVFYYATASRTLGSGDSAILIGDIQDLKISTSSISHNLSLLFGKLFSWLPVGSLPFRCNLMSVFFGGLAVVLFYALLVRTCRSRLIAAAAAALWMVSHSMWWHSTMAESYAINVCLITIAIYLLDRYRRDEGERWLLALIGLSGISIFQHAQLGVIGLAAIIVTVARVLRMVRERVGPVPVLGFLGKCAVVSGFSLAPYVFVMLRDAARGGGLGSAVSEAAGGVIQGRMFEWAHGLGFIDTLLWIVVQFPSPFLLLIAVGLVEFLWRWRAGAATAAVMTMFLTNTVFFIFMHTWDRFAYMLISYFILAFWGALGLAQVWSRVRRSASKLLMGAMIVSYALCLAAPPWVYANMTSWRGRPGSLWAMRFNNSGPEYTIDHATYLANPNKRRNTEIEDFADLLFDKLPANVIYLTDDNWFFALQYYRVYEGRRPDMGLSFADPFGFTNWGLSDQEFESLLQYAQDAQIPLYLGSLAAPFDEMLVATGRTWPFERVPLDDRRWVYRLAPATTTAQPPRAAAGFLPTPRGMSVSYGPNASNPINDSVRRDRDFTVRFEFGSNPIAFPVVYRWIAPNGKARFASPVFVVPAGSGAHEWVQDHRGVLTPGPWNIEVWVGDNRVDDTRLMVR